MNDALVPAKLLAESDARFGRARLFSAPGRVNLIGEHTDYNEGFVLPMAIDKRAFVAGEVRSDRVVSIRSLNANEQFEFDLDRPGPPRRGIWLDYVEGTAQAMILRGLPVSGANLLISSEVPAGSGLSSSAALEISVGYALARLADTDAPDLVELALSGQSAENNYVGAHVGIMDQYIAALAQEGSALLIDCRTLEPKPVPLALGSASILICDTRVKHELASSAYNERRAQCEAGVLALSRVIPELRSLRDVSPAQFEAHRAVLPEVVQRRCRHVIHENVRTLRAATLLESGQLEEFGALMLESHRSLRDDYEVSAPELDLVVDTAAAENGVYGARMTGGGFGGCSVALVEARAIERVEVAIRRRFTERFGMEPTFFASTACAGVGEHTR